MYREQGLNKLSKLSAMNGSVSGAGIEGGSRPLIERYHH